MLILRKFCPQTLAEYALTSSVYYTHGLEARKEGIIYVLRHQIGRLIEVLAYEIDLRPYRL